MNFKVFKVILGIIVLSFLGCQGRLEQQSIRVKEVIDGDTIVLENGKVVRYIGIDTPETKKRIDDRWVESPQPFAYEAKELNEKLVGNKYVRLEFDIQKTDRYGRLLAYCFVGEPASSKKNISTAQGKDLKETTNQTFVNAKLLEEGYAYLYTYPPNVKYTDLFVKVYCQAREGQKGLWAKEYTITSEEAIRFIGKVKTVEGKVRSTHEGKKVIFLNFGKDWRKDFTVAIFKKDIPFFVREKINPLVDYKAKKLRVSGLIKEYNGPEIIVHHPSQIEIVE